VSAPENANKQETAVGFIVSRVQAAGDNAFALRDPGQPVTGPESLLYPIKPGS
jgi:hypothetical protein